MQTNCSSFAVARQLVGDTCTPQFPKDEIHVIISNIQIVELGNGRSAHSSLLVFRASHTTGAPDKEIHLVNSNLREQHVTSSSLSSRQICC